MKKALFSLLALLVLCALLVGLCLPAAALDVDPSGDPVELPWGDGHAPGDVNGDGAINKKDSLALKKYLADNSEAIDKTAADVVKDGVVNKKDSLRLKQYLAGWDVALGA